MQRSFIDTVSRVRGDDAESLAGFLFITDDVLINTGAYFVAWVASFCSLPSVPICLEAIAVPLLTLRSYLAKPTAGNLATDDGNHPNRL